MGGEQKGDREMGLPVAPLSLYQTLFLGLRGSAGRGSGRGASTRHLLLPSLALPLTGASSAFSPPQSRP